jgi:hypothetical protein
MTGRAVRVALLLSTVALFVVALRALAPGDALDAGRSAVPDGALAPSPLRGTWSAAGSATESPPAGWQAFDGLAHASDLGVDVHRLCSGPARRLGFAVACPHLLPPPGDEYGLPRCGTALLPNPGCIIRPDPATPDLAAFFLQYEPFLDANGDLVWRDGLMVAAFRTEDAVPGSAFDALFLCGGARPVDDASLVFPWSHRATAHRGHFVECTNGPAPSGGRTILWWRIGGQTFVLGVPGSLEATRNVLRDLAASVEVLRPAD